MNFQFQRYEPEDGFITERDFARILLLYAGLSNSKRVRMIKRVKKKYSEDEEAQVGQVS